MKYNVGDKVRVKSKEWWDSQPKNERGSVKCGGDNFTKEMTCMCGKTVEIKKVLPEVGKYLINEFYYQWTAEMFEGNEGIDETPRMFFAPIPTLKNDDKPSDDIIYGATF